VEADSVRFGGWAGDLQGGRLPERVLVFSGDRLLYGGTTSVERRDIARRHPRLIHAGFVFELPLDLVDAEGEKELRFFAIAGGVASELAYHPRFPWK